MESSVVDTESNTNYLYHSPAYEAALKEDWATAAKELSSLPQTTTTTSNILQLAVLSPTSTSFLRNQLSQTSLHSLRQTEHVSGNTLLHSAAAAANLGAARVLLGIDTSLTRDLISRPNAYGDTPVHCAAAFGNWDLTVYLLSLIFHIWPHEDDLSAAGSPLAASQGVKLLQLLIAADFYDIAVAVVERHPSLSGEKDCEGTTALECLAKRHQAFPKKQTDRNFPTQLLTKNNKPIFVGSMVISCGGEDEGSMIGKVWSFGWSLWDTAWDIVWGVWDTVSPFRTLNWIEALPLLKQLISGASRLNDSDRRSLLGRASRMAAEQGNVLFVEALTTACPLAILERDNDGDDMKGSYNLVELAVLTRQDDVFQSLYEKKYSLGHLITRIKTSYFDDEGDREKKKNNLLHLAARLGPRRTVYGPLAHMQQEIRFFKTVETMVHPRLREAQNQKGQTPREIFTEEHKKLVEDSEKWLEDMAKQCTTISALLISAFSAAVFTSPLSNFDKDEDKTPKNFWIQLAIIIFTFSNSVAFYLSCLSLLMFVTAMVWHYSVLDDFLGVLPRRLAIGLAALFFGGGFMLISFLASLYATIASKTTWKVLDWKAPDQELSWMALMFCSISLVPWMLYVATHLHLVATVLTGVGRRRELIFS
ncbi:hypothetical protein LINPERHAP1_LOCUS16924 [Linum perenne]